jgi:hypothetical protein
MHILFIPYGKRQEVELLLRDMEAQKHWLPMRKEQEQTGIWVQGTIRMLPFGIYEYICPKENGEMVMKTLDFGKKSPYDFPKLFMNILNKILKIEKIPEIKTDKKYLWIKDNVSIIPLGIKTDNDDVVEDGHFYPELKGYVHEAL